MLRCALLGLILLAGAALPDRGAVAADDATTAAEEREAHRAELEAITREITLSEDRQAELRREIAALDKDRASLAETLIETNQRVQVLETQLADAETRLKGLFGDEEHLRDSLRSRRGTLSEVLAALQRMGRKPPPALLVRPQDALASVRSAILLGAVVPDLREEALKLSGDLDALVAIRAEQARERDRLRDSGARLAEERQRLELLIDERQRATTQSAEDLRAAQARAVELAAQATSLRELIARMEAGEAAPGGDQVAAIPPQGRVVSPLQDAERITPAIPFKDARGRLPRPAAGNEVVAFGGDDGFGGRAQGVSIATRPGAAVSTPADGWVVYAGPFRSYGNLLIINAGGGYHVLLAGLERIDVELGQFVLAGEPVAAMGARRLADAGATNVSAALPVLYVEFRKDGNSIDPGPWWAPPNDEKVGG